MNDIFKELRRLVEKADLIGNSQHCAAVVHKGKILSVGFNKKKTHPFQKKYSDRPERLYLHAELDAILGIKDKTILSSCDIYVLRLSKGNQVLNSEPCEGCKKALKFYQFQNIYWTTDANKDWC